MKTTMMTMRIYCVVCIVIPNRMKFKSAVTSARLIFATRATGATNFKPITKFASAIAVMPFTVVSATKSINAMIVPKSSVQVVAHCCRASFVAEAFVKNAPRHVGGTFFVVSESVEGDKGNFITC